MKQNIIGEEKISHYFDVARRALQEAEIIVPKGSHLERAAKDFYDMATRYYDDAKYYFEKKDDSVTAFASLNYLHGYLDAGARLGIFKVKSNELFAFEEEL